MDSQPVFGDAQAAPDLLQPVGEARVLHAGIAQGGINHVGPGAAPPSRRGLGSIQLHIQVQVASLQEHAAQFTMPRAHAGQQILAQGQAAAGDHQVSRLRGGEAGDLPVDPHAALAVAAAQVDDVDEPILAEDHLAGDVKDTVGELVEGRGEPTHIHAAFDELDSFVRPGLLVQAQPQVRRPLAVKVVDELLEPLPALDETPLGGGRLRIVSRHL